MLSKNLVKSKVVAGYAIAQALKTTVEYLVDGQNGEKYLHCFSWNDPRAMRVPDRIRGIAEGLLLLDDDQLVGIEANVAALAGVKRGEELKKAG
ncbi:MAG: hypothetical protein FWH41_08235 [Treponema sp.]|nr:hypothetical protein [Treponema sp.]